jgi:hypothetical protein
LRSQVRHQQGRYENRHDDGFHTVNRDIAGGSNPGQHKREQAFERNLQQLNNSHHSQSRTQSHKLRPKRDTPVAKKRITKWRIHMPNFLPAPPPRKPKTKIKGKTANGHELTRNKNEPQINADLRR